MEINDSLLNSGELFAGRYNLLKLLGEGGMGKVYLAEDTMLNNEVIALKTLQPQLSQNEESVQRFYREVQLNRKVHHPNIVRIFDVGQANGLLFLSMEYVEGASLKDKIGKLSIEEVLRITREISRGLAAIHEVGVIHRDLKPGNIILEAGGEAKIADFGIATSAASDLTSHNEIIGCIEYIAPEIWKGRDATSLSDIYALGVIVYELITGEPPFRGNSPADLMRQHLTTPTPKIEDPKVPDYLKAAVYKMLAKRDVERPKSCLQVIKLLNPTISDDSFTRPTILSGTQSQIIDRQSTTFERPRGLPDYSQLKRSTNPDTYKKAQTRKRQRSSSGTDLAKFRSQAFGDVHEGSAVSNIKWITRSIGSLLTISAIAWVLNNYLIPYDRILHYSFKGKTQFHFLLYLIFGFCSVSILLSVPIAYVAALRPRRLKQRTFPLVWGEGAAVLLACGITLFFWDLFQNAENLLHTLVQAPNVLYHSYVRAVESMIYVALFIPQYIFQDQSLLFYVCLGFYAMGIFAIFQSSLKHRNTMLLICMATLPVVLASEYVIPLYFSDRLFEVLNSKVYFDIGDYRFSITRYAAWCGIINWFLIFMMLRVLTFIFGSAKRR